MRLSASSIPCTIDIDIFIIAISNIADQLVESGESLHARGTSARGMREAIKKKFDRASSSATFKSIVIMFGWSAIDCTTLPSYSCTAILITAQTGNYKLRNKTRSLCKRTCLFRQ